MRVVLDADDSGGSGGWCWLVVWVVVFGVSADLCVVNMVVV